MSSHTSMQRGPYGGYSGSVIAPQTSYWGWSHQNQRLEMMDLAAYLDSLRQTYDAALQDISDRLQSLSAMFGAAPPAVAMDVHHHGHHGHHGRPGDCGCGGHGHRHDDEHDHCGCGCKDHHDCGCDCCITDADIVVYAHCAELRVVPIEVRNDTRHDRESVSVEISDARTAGGTVLPWTATINPTGPVTLPGCSTTKFELLVHVRCGDQDQPKGKTESDVLRMAVAQRTGGNDVDGCEVGYVTVRFGGCVIRPIVVAIAVLPDRCDAYRVGCSCSCCC